jgi:hypothetical protein
MVSLGLGGTFRLVKLRAGRTSDSTFAYGNRSFVFQPPPLALTYFFGKHWGVTANLQFSVASSKDSDFSAALDREYGGAYFANGVGAFYDEPMSLGLVGAVYRREWRRFFYFGGLALGVTEFNTGRARGSLKARGANTVLDVYYEPGQDHNNYFTLAPSFTAGYKWKRMIYLHVRVMSTYVPVDFTIVKTVKDKNSGESISVEEYRYKKGVSSLTIVAGASFVFGKRRR